MPSRHQIRRRINIFLDLDNTLISSLSKDEERKIMKPRMKKFEWKNMEGVYKVFARPGLQNFLDYLFQNFNVSVWTAASKSYALFIIDKFILENHPERTLDYILFSHHCRRSKRQKNAQKSLDMLKTVYNLHDFDLNSTYIIDDHPEVYKTQPKNCIHIKPFEFTDRRSYEDTELNNIKNKLEKITSKK